MADSDDSDEIVRALLKALGNPKIKKALGLALAAPAVSGDDRTVRDLWSDYAPWAKDHVGSWPTRSYHAKPLFETTFAVEGQTRTLGDYTAGELTPAVCDYYRAARRRHVSGHSKREISDGTVNTEITSLQMCFAWHVDEAHLAKNPIAGWRRTKDNRRQTYLTPEEFVEFIGHGPPLYQDIALVAYRCMLRNTEVRLLEKAEVDWTVGVIHLSSERNKNDEPRSVPIPKDALAILENHARSSRGRYVFVHPRDPKRQRAITKTSFWRWHDKARRASGMVGVGGEVLVFHHARHGGITTLLETAPASFVSEAAGVSMRVMDDVYKHYSGRQRQLLRDHMNAMPMPALDGDRHGPHAAPPPPATKKSAARKR